MRSNDAGKIVSEIAYDRLVIGVGALTNTFHVPGADTHAFFLKVGAAKLSMQQLLLTHAFNGLADSVHCTRGFHRQTGRMIAAFVLHERGASSFKESTN